MSWKQETEAERWHDARPVLDECRRVLGMMADTAEVELDDAMDAVVDAYCDVLESDYGWDSVQAYDVVLAMVPDTGTVTVTCGNYGTVTGGNYSTVTGGNYSTVGGSDEG